MCTENLIRVDDALETPKLTEQAALARAKAAKQPRTSPPPAEPEPEAAKSEPPKATGPAAGAQTFGETMLTFALIVLAAMPVHKHGQCPSGFRESGGYCAPMSRGAPLSHLKIYLSN